MKRSEMIEKLLNTIHCAEKKGNISESELAIRVLKVIENAGMVPSYYDKEYHDEPECNGMIYEWEEE